MLKNLTVQRAVLYYKNIINQLRFYIIYKQ